MAEKFSSKLMQMKFMQRGVERKNMMEAAKSQEEKEDENHWKAARKSEAKGCVIITGRDPLPGAVSGRMSFSSFNPTTEKMQAEMLALKSGKPQPASRSEEKPSEAKDIGDEDMAKAFQRPVHDPLPVRDLKKQKLR